MKNIFLLILVLFLVSCSCENEDAKESNKPLNDYSLFETEIGKNVVYGVRLKISNASDETEFYGYQVRLNKDDQTWIDTVYTDIAANDTIELEVIFSEAIVQDESNVTFNIETFAAKQ